VNDSGLHGLGSWVLGPGSWVAGLGTFNASVPISS
jgi:hypothetical protein